jgi:hypothetical protein
MNVSDPPIRLRIFDDDGNDDERVRFCVTLTLLNLPPVQPQLQTHHRLQVRPREQLPVQPQKRRLSLFGGLPKHLYTRPQQSSHRLPPEIQSYLAFETTAADGSKTDGARTW